MPSGKAGTRVDAPAREKKRHLDWKRSDNVKSDFHGGLAGWIHTCLPHMSVDMSIHMSINTCLPRRVYTHFCPDAVTHACTHACTHVYTHACTHACTHAYTHAYTHACTHACTLICTHVRTQRAAAQGCTCHHCHRHHVVYCYVGSWDSDINHVRRGGTGASGRRARHSSIEEMGRPHRADM